MRNITIYNVCVTSEEGEFNRLFISLPTKPEIMEAISDEATFLGMVSCPEHRERIRILIGLLTVVQLWSTTVPIVEGEENTVSVSVAGASIGRIVITTETARMRCEIPVMGGAPSSMAA